MIRKQFLPHPTLFNPITTTNCGQIARRRSTRIFLNAPVGISGEDRLKVSFSMPAKAIGLNKHGAALQISRDLVVGSIIMIKNKRGVQVSARIVSQRAATQGVSTYGIEFVEQQEKADNFWGISFPSDTDERPVSRSSTLQASMFGHKTLTK
jgi:PilZ domain-containing protein